MDLEKDQKENMALEGIKDILSDREKRLKSLYYIKNDKGAVVLFQPNEVQRDFFKLFWFLNIILKSRQHGISTFIEILMLDMCFFNSNTSAGIIADTLPNAIKLLAKIKFAYDNLPEVLKRENPLTTESKTELTFKNGSNIVVGTSARSSTLQFLHISEFGKICARTPEKAQEIITGSLEAVAVECYVSIESTAEGEEGEFHAMCMIAKKLKELGKKLTPMDYRFFFYAWWKKAANVIDPEGIEIPHDLLEYFEEMRIEHGLVLTPEQKAWYVKKESVQKDKMKREHPTIPEEAFKASLEGAYFTREFVKMRKDKRIKVFPVLKNRIVHTFWDVGLDMTAVWFVQIDGDDPKTCMYMIVDFWCVKNEKFGYCIGEVKRKDYIFGLHVGPHDINKASYEHEDGRLETARKLGMNFEIVPKTSCKSDDIEIAGNFLDRCVFHEEACKEGIEHLELYSRKWDPVNAKFRDEDKHDDHSHPADAYRTFVIGIAQPFFEEFFENTEEEMSQEEYGSYHRQGAQANPNGIKQDLSGLKKRFEEKKQLTS
jgi:hypothetical protein